MPTVWTSTFSGRFPEQEAAMLAAGRRTVPLNFMLSCIGGRLFYASDKLD